MMKAINLMFVSVAVLLAAGCSQNEVTEVNPDVHPKVGFGVYTGVPARGVDMTTDAMKEDPDDADKYGGFGIMGYYTGQEAFDNVKTTVTPSYMHNQKVGWNKTGSVWAYSPVKYWPNAKGDKISFFAYAPYEPNYSTGGKTGVVTSGIAEKGIPSITFSVKEEKDLKKMVDLVVASQIDQEYKEDKGGKIDFKFEHTLSRIYFKAQLNDGKFDDMDGTNSFVYITRMWIVGSKHGTTTETGNLSLLYPGADSNDKSKFYTKAKWSELHWNYTDAVIPEKDFSLDAILDVDNGITESNPTEGHSGAVKGVKITKSSQGAGNAVGLFPANHYLYLIPVGDSDPDVSKTGGSAENDIWIGFHYDIVTKDASSSSDAYLASHAESVIKLPAGHMKRNSSYLYTLKINLHEIEIGEVEVSPWTDSPKDVDIE